MAQYGAAQVLRCTEKVILYTSTSLSARIGVTPTNARPPAGAQVVRSFSLLLLHNLGLNYSTKKKEAFMAAVNRLDSVELVLVSVQGKNSTYQFYYFEKYEAIDGESAYLISPEQFRNETVKKSAVFMNYKKKKHFFYRADCFRQKLKESDLLQQSLKKE